MKKAILSAIFVIGAFAAHASYLVWQVTASDYSDYSGAYGTDWNTVRLVQVSGVDSDAVTAWNSGNKFSEFGTSTDYVSSHDVVGTTTTTGQLVGVPTSKLSANIGDLDGTQYAYYVELVNSSTSVAYARSNAVSYSELVTSGYAGAGELSLGNLASITPWHASGYTAVPEPTSAILMLFGAAFLGLKRKNRSIA